jgi:hypothetical protein
MPTEAIGMCAPIRAELLVLFILACGVPELGHRSWPGLLCGSLVFVNEGAAGGLALGPLVGQFGEGVAGAELAAAMRSPSVVVRFVLG